MIDPKIVFAMVPHEWKLKNEVEAKRYFLLFMKMAGADITSELESSKGRADAIVETEKAVYVFEFKYGKSARANPGLRKGALSRMTGIGERSVKRYLAKLEGQVEFRGAPKTGGYYVR